MDGVGLRLGKVGRVAGCGVEGRDEGAEEERAGINGEEGGFEGGGEERGGGVGEHWLLLLLACAGFPVGG